MNLLAVLPKNYFSFFTGFMAHIPLPQPLRGILNRWFVNKYSINMSEAEKSIDDYSCIGALFVRNLKPDARPLGNEPIAPVDGTLRSVKKIDKDLLEQIKDKNYSLKKLLGDEKDADLFHEGVISNFYLAPHNYHQIHSPVSGIIKKRVHIPGALWPVNDWSLNTINELFSVNERIVVYIETPNGLVAVIMVGATNVGRIKLTFEDFETNKAPWQSKSITVNQFSEMVPIAAGGKLGVFELGSTVIVLFSKEYAQNIPSSDRMIGKEVQLGTSYFAS